MPCAKLPVPTIPTFPSSITIPIPPLPALPVPLLVLPCCNIPIPPFPIALPALPIGVVLTAPEVAALMGYVQAFQAYLDQVPIKCPIE
jgi:hypothetical protein